MVRLIVLHGIGVAECLGEVDEPDLAATRCVGGVAGRG